MSAFTEYRSGIAAVHCVLQAYCGLPVASASMEELLSREVEQERMSSTHLAVLLRRFGMPAVPIACPWSRFRGQVERTQAASHVLLFVVNTSGLPEDGRWAMVTGVDAGGLCWVECVGPDEADRPDISLGRRYLPHLVEVRRELPKLSMILCQPPSYPQDIHNLS